MQRHEDVDLQAARVVPAGGGELLGEAPDRRVELLSDADALHATTSRFGPGRAGADLHVHREHTDAFFVLDGELTVRLGPQGDEVTVPAGTLALVPPLVVHGFRNAGGVDLSYLNLHAPGRGFAGYMRALRDGEALVYDQHEPPADGGRSPGDVRLVAVQADGPPVQVLTEDEHLEVHALSGDAVADVPEATAAYEALFVLTGRIAVDPQRGGPRAGAGAWVELPGGAARPPVVADAAGTRVLRIAVRPGAP